MSNLFAALRRLALLVLPLACIVACGSGGTGENAATESAALTVDASNINIGFGGAALLTGDPFQFNAIADFFAYSPVNGPLLCHRYLRWDIALDSEGEAKNPQSRRNFEDWLNGDKPLSAGTTKNPCEEVLISFKGTNYDTTDAAGKVTTHEGPEPKGVEDNIVGCPRCFGSAFRKFLEKYADLWASKGPGHKFSFTAWNEPNNPAVPGNGTGKRLSPETAAQYYLVAKKICNEAKYQCDVAAGDMASNGAMVDHFQTHCKADIGADDCKDATWLDSYKASIVKHASEHGFTDKFRPQTWAYHAWQEINDYVYPSTRTGKTNPDPCGTDHDDKCATNLLVASLKGSWLPKAIWDTEVGVGQRPKQSISYEMQAKGAAYLLSISAKAGVSRIYYQGVETGPWRITCGGKIRPAYCVLAHRNTTFPSDECLDDKCASIEDVELDEDEQAAPCPPGQHSIGSSIESGVDGGGGFGLVNTDAGPILACVDDADAPLVGSGSSESDAGSPLVGGGSLLH